VTTTVTASARRAFATLDAQRTAAMVAQFRREFASEATEIAQRVERVAASDTIIRTAVDVAAARDAASHVNDAAALASTQGLDFLDVVAADGTIHLVGALARTFWLPPCVGDAPDPIRRHLLAGCRTA
jgi:hypothetical protein